MLNEVKYSGYSLEKLKGILCKRCFVKPIGWDDDVYKCWLRYINGTNRNELIKNTRFSLYVSPRYHFRNHPCYKKIANVRNLFRKVKTTIKKSIINYPWLLGIYYADGCIKNKTQLCFFLSAHEKILVKRIVKQLKEIIGEDSHIVEEKIGNMWQIRTHSVEICREFPNKKNEKKFNKIWNKFTEEEKLEFIGGYIDGDGCCNFIVGVNSVQLYAKSVPFLINSFREFLSKYGYISTKGFLMYISPTVAKHLKKFIVKKDIKRPYNGSVDVKTAFKLLRKGNSLRKISRKLNFNKKTIQLALRQSYPRHILQEYYYSNIHNL